MSKIESLKTEYAVRIIAPDKFKKSSFRSKRISPNVRIIIGRLKGKTISTVQAYRFNKEKFSLEKVKSWLKKHKVEVKHGKKKKV